jgi:rhamnose utilization protein RhaD (predicted bifunctional aldolase and dehydrogenase)
MNAVSTEDIEIPGATELERLVNRSRKIGADPTLVVHGGGNTSTKTREVDHLGRERDVLRIKGSGTDLKTIGPDGFPGLFLDELRPLQERAVMSDEEMVAYLAHCMVEPGSRRPSIETLLHAFLPARHVDHVHADVICALTNNPEPERHVRAALGPDVAVVPYIRPGFDLSRQVAGLAEARAVVLAKHGLVTWGETHEESYGQTLRLVAQAEAYLAERLSQAAGEGVADLSDDERRLLLATLRGRLSRDRRVILAVDPTQRAFADRQDVDAVATEARATPDHILRIGARSAVVRKADEVEPVLTAFGREYREYFARHQDRLPAGMGMLNPLPRVVLVPGLGAVAAGADAKMARANAEIAYRSHRVTAMTRDAFGAIDWLSEADVFDFDYWPLELAKLASAPAPKLLAGHVAILLDAGTPMMDAIANRLAAEGAHLVLAGLDPAAVAASVARLPSGTAIASTTEMAVSAAVDTFGGVDILVSAHSAPRTMLAELNQVFAAQGLPGVIVLVRSDPQTEHLRQFEAFRSDVRVNAVHHHDGAAPDHIAEAIVYLASSRAEGVDGVMLPVS